MDGDHDSEEHGVYCFGLDGATFGVNELLVWPVMCQRWLQVGGEI